MKGNGLTLSGCADGPNPTNSIIVPLDPRNNLPTSLAYCTTHELAANLVSTVTEVSSANLNLSMAEKEWLKWHQRLGHASFSVVQFLC